jgi:hypothetical protein
MILIWRHAARLYRTTERNAIPLTPRVRVCANQTHGSAIRTGHL